MSQVGYGHSDPVGVPFDLYTGAGQIVTGFNITMATASLVLNPATTPLATGTVNLPLNPPDGCVAEISSTQVITTLTVAANSGDVIVNGILGAASTLTPVAATGGSATAAIKYKYSLNGGVPGNSQSPSAVAVNPRTWFRVQ